MTLFQKMSESTGLVSGMAERLDIDITERMAQDADSFGRSYLNMVMRCAKCSDHEACTRLQDENPALDAAPSYCENRDVLKRA
jgi:hypothetical protein